GSQQSFIDCDLGMGGATGRRCVFSDGANNTKFTNCRFNGAGTTDTFVEITEGAEAPHLIEQPRLPSLAGP
ncbi:MAG: hypothetical protein ACXWNX_12425, partial [Isosphaeraceae bacterium]